LFAGSANVYDATKWVARVLTSLIKKRSALKNRLLGKVWGINYMVPIKITILLQAYNDFKDSLCQIF